MSLEGLGADVPAIYFVLTWLAAIGGILEMQKIARREIMAHVRAPMRHLVRLALALLMYALLWSGFDVLHGRDLPSGADLGVVAALTFLMYAHAISGCAWAHDKTI